ncbi:MAG: hypothetical protein WD016_05290 [Balneolaceae bacterium]
MKILAIQKETPTLTSRDFAPHLRGEAKQGWQLYKEGVIREMYFRDDKAEAVLILECADLKEAAEKLATLPLVKSEMIEFELIPLRPYHGYERLFKK